jgi:OOP family OmpA-OmpF porin
MLPRAEANKRLRPNANEVAPWFALKNFSNVRSTLLGVPQILSRLTSLFFVCSWFVLASAGSIEDAYAYNPHVQWASNVISFTSQLGAKEYSAKQVLGKPNKCPDAGDSPCAWAAAHDGPDGGGEERLKVGYTHAMYIQQVAIAENFNPGAIERVYLYDVEGERHEVYHQSPKAASASSRVLTIVFPKTEYAVNAVEIILQCGQVDGWNEIDAIGISESAEPVSAEINVTQNAESEPVRENLGSAVNSSFDEVLPVISPDGRTIFIDRKNHPDNIGNHDNIWYSELDQNNVWSNAVNIGPPLNNGGRSFVASITPDGNTLLLGGTYRDKDSDDFGIWLSHRQEESWGYPEKVRVKDFYTNSQFIEFCLSNDNRAILMSLERDEGLGRKDIYVSFVNADGSWTRPKNLGPVVNSAADEGMPFLASDGVTLYYASEGFSGYGDMDMFLTRRLDDTWEHWSEPQNLGPGLNTPGWDAYYTIPASGDYAYFISTEGSIGQGDVFRVKLPETLKPKPVVLISGKVLDAKSHKPVRASIHYELLAQSKEVGAASSNAQGKFKLVLPAGAVYGFHAEAKGYASVNQNLDLQNVSTYKELTQDLSLVPLEVGQTVLLNNIFFDFGKSTLQPTSFPELDRVVKMLIDNPKMIIAINGHTDSVGSHIANTQLSTDRAASVGKYLIAKNITPLRLRVQGFAETMPVAPNSTEDGRHKNRRVEFTILRE